MDLDLVLPALKSKDHLITKERIVNFLDGFISWEKFLEALGLASLKKHFQSKAQLVDVLKKALARKPELKNIVSMYETYGDTSYAECDLENPEAFAKFVKRCKNLALYHTEQRLNTSNSSDAAKAANDSLFLLRCSIEGENP